MGGSDLLGGKQIAPNAKITLVPWDVLVVEGSK
jgi:hypothetical protein